MITCVWGGRSHVVTCAWERVCEHVCVLRPELRQESIGLAELEGMAAPLALSSPLNLYGALVASLPSGAPGQRPALSSPVGVVPAPAEEAASVEMGAGVGGSGRDLCWVWSPRPGPTLLTKGSS